MPALPEPSTGRLHPHAWDYLFSHVPAMYVKARLRSGRWVGGYYGEHATRGIAAYASSYPERPEVFLTHLVPLDPRTGTWPVDEQGKILLHHDEGLLLSGDRVEHLEVLYPYTDADSEEEADDEGPKAPEEASQTGNGGLSQR